MKRTKILLTDSPTRLTDKAALLARLIWVALVAPTVAMFVIGIPHAYHNLLQLNPETVADLGRFGLSPREVNVRAKFE